MSEISQVENSEVDLSNMVELVDTLKPLLERLKPHIENGEYSILISDETSARIPTLIVRNIVNNIYRKKGTKSIDALFVLGKYGREHGKEQRERDKMLTPELNRRLEIIRKSNPNKKALIVTELIKGGWNVGSISELLDDLGMPHDIAALRMDRTVDDIQVTRAEYQYKPLAPKGEVFYGKIGTGIPIGSVEDDNIKGVFNKRDAGDKPSYDITAIRDTSVRPITLEARKQVALLSASLIKQLKI